jgi:hypothetical protein
MPKAIKRSFAPKRGLSPLPRVGWGFTPDAWHGEMENRFVDFTRFPLQLVLRNATYHKNAPGF